MPDYDEFFISYEGKQVKVTTVLNGANIYFSVHLNNPVTIAEGMVNEDFLWYDIDRGVTPLATGLGEIIDSMGI